MNLNTVQRFWYEHHFVIRRKKSGCQSQHNVNKLICQTALHIWALHVLHQVFVFNRNVKDNDTYNNTTIIISLSLMFLLLHT